MEFGETLLQTWGITKVFVLEGEGLVNGLDSTEKRWWPSNAWDGWDKQVDDLGSFWGCNLTTCWSSPLCNRKFLYLNKFLSDLLRCDNVFGWKEWYFTCKP
jgi:hypothetical protein